MRIIIPNQEGQNVRKVKKTLPIVLAAIPGVVFSPIEYVITAAVLIEIQYAYDEHMIFHQIIKLVII